MSDGHQWFEQQRDPLVQKIIRAILSRVRRERTREWSVVWTGPDDPDMKHPLHLRPGFVLTTGVRTLALCITPATPVKSQRDAERLVRESLVRMFHADETSVDAFRAALAETWKNQLARSQGERRRFDVFCPISLTFEESVRSRTAKILGKRFRFIGKQTMLRSIPRDHRRSLRMQLRHPLDELPSTAIRFSTVASSPQEVIDDFEAPFELLRGTLELTRGRGHVHHHGGRPEHQRAAFPCSQEALMVPDSADEEISIVQFNIPQPLRSFPGEVSPDFWMAFRSNCTRFSNVPPERSTLALLRDALRLYVQGLDAHFAHHAFLAFWQLAEVLTRAELHHGSVEKVTGRLAMFNTRWHGVDVILGDLARKRNRIVHAGDVERVNDDDVNLMKIFAERALIRVFELRDKLPTKQQLDLYYRYRAVGTTELAATQSVIAFVEDARRRNER